MTIRTIALSTALFACTVPVAFGQVFSDHDKSFLKDAAEANLAEVKMGELTIKTTKNPEIKTFAQKMITDHRALYNGMKPVAAKAGVTLPTSPSLTADATYAKLKVLTGETYDKSYVKSMVSDHHEDLDKMKQENQATNNPDIKALTEKASTVIAGHTKMIDGIAGKMGLQ
jgi:putative membrane protein